MPKKIQMLRDEVVSYGPQKLFAGETYDLPDGLAQYLVREGIAQDVHSEAATHPASSEIPKVQAEHRDVSGDRGWEHPVAASMPDEADPPVSSEIPKVPADMPLDDMTREDLYALAQAVELEGRSTMKRDELIAALRGEQADGG